MPKPENRRIGTGKKRGLKKQTPLDREMMQQFAVETARIARELSQIKPHNQAEEKVFAAAKKELLERQKVLRRYKMDIKKG